MTKREGSRIEELVNARLEAGLSRAQMLKAVGVGAALAVVPAKAWASGPLPPVAKPGPYGRPGSFDFPFSPQVAGSYTPESIQDILDVLVTMERFAQAVVVDNVTGPVQAGINPVQISLQQANAAAQLSRVAFLESLGARPLTDTFTLGPRVPFSPATLKRGELVTTVLIAAYLTAAREFAELGQPLLVKWAFQMGAYDAEQRGSARTIMAVQGVPGTDPPTNKAFETDLFLYVRDAYSLLTKVGLFGGLPRRIPYPTREQALAAAGPYAALIIQQTPNNATTSVTSPPQALQERA